MTISKCASLALLVFVTCTLLIYVCHACPEQLPSTVSLRTNGSLMLAVIAIGGIYDAKNEFLCLRSICYSESICCQLFPSQQLFCSQFFNESSMVYIHDNINYTFLNEQLFEWRNNGYFGKISSDILGKPTSFCAMQIPYMVCVYLYPPCDDGVPLAFCEDQCSNLRSQCCDAVENLTLLIADLDNSSPLHLLCDYDNVDVAGNLYPFPAGDPSCYAVGSTPQIFNDTLLNITGVDYTVAAGEFADPCIYQFNRSYALVCNASAVPAPQLAWYYRKMLLGEITIVNNGTNGHMEYYIDSSTSILVINNLTRNNTGIYFCNATNDIGFHLLTVEAIVAYCYDSDGTCHQIKKAFIQNCSQCIYPDDDCIIQCDPVECPSVPNNCDGMVPTSDGCCMTCASSEEDAEDNDLGTGATAVITVIAVLAILLLIIILILLYLRQTIKPRKSNRLDIQRLSMSVNANYERTLPEVYNVLAKAKEECVVPIKYKEIFSDLSDVEIPLEILSIGMELGEGAFGTVYKGTVTVHQSEDTTEMIDVAVKTINADALDSDEVESFLNECVLMKKIEHPNVLGLLGVCLNTEDGSPYIVLPFMENGDLKTFLYSKRTTSGSVLKNPEGLDYVTLLRMCCEIANGMKYLVHHKFVHRDLAARNCLVASDMTIKVGDFGLARQLYSKDYYKLRHCAKVPIKWMPLESIHDGIFNEKTDVWAFGVTCWEVFTLGASPYSALDFDDMLLFLERGSRLCKPQLCSQKVYEILLQCWQLSPNNRPSFSVLAQILTELLLPNEYVNIRNSRTE